MSTILGFLFILFMGILLFGASLIGWVLKVLFGSKKRSGDGSSRSAENAQRKEEEQQPTHKKIFDKSDGEYVDFEEVDENK